MTASAIQLARCLGPLVAGRSVAVIGARARECRPALDAAGSLRDLPSGFDDVSRPEALDVVISLDPFRTDAALADPDLLARLADGALVAVWSHAPPDEGAVRARHHAHYTLRLLTGALLADARFAASRVAALRDHDVAEGAALHLMVWSNAPIPTLLPGLYDNAVQTALKAGEREPLDPPAAPRLTNRAQAADGVHRAAALADRLLKVEDRTMALRAEAIRLKEAASAGQSPGGQAFFDVPRTKHGWALAHAPSRPIATLELYDLRPDDAVILEAAMGAAFMETHDLLGPDPDFAGAITAINAISRTLRLDDVDPDVSIVVPVYGQLPYTLNCIDSLFRHASRFSAEIILIDDCSPDGFTAQFAPRIEGIRYHRQAVNGGFIKSCNDGAAMARGRHVLMLNNDTRLPAKWLDEIIGAFEVFPRAGLVGSKMLYPDGSLQEAGGILWRDGGAWNYGRDDDPNRPQYCYARQVDYISGCSIALPTPLWRRLGGFDPHYTPAYAEDADLCQRVIAQGLEVWFQPTSRVIHYEGKTSGTSTASGAKAYQVRNLKKLFLRWRDRFETHRRNGEAPFLERERRVTRRMLFVDAVTPTPNQDAGSVQTVLGIRCGRAAGYKTHFVPEDNWLFEPYYTPDLQREGVDCAYAPFELGFENYIRRYGWLFDVVIVYRVGVMAKCLTLLRQYAPQALVIFHLADLHYLRLLRQAQLGDSAAGLSAALELKEKELAMVRGADCTITHSTVEADILAEEAPEAAVTVWPLMMELAGTKVGHEDRRDVCFLGGYRHAPNVDAVIHFTQAVLPGLLARRPGLRFIVAGANPTAEIQALASETIIVTGLVDDLSEVFDKVRVFVCPLRVGAGAKGKIMSALAHGLPIVSTSIGVEGAGLKTGEDVLVADTPEAMIDSILDLYDSQSNWEKMSLNGQDLIRREFSLEMGLRKLEEAIDKAYRVKLELGAA